MCNLKKREAFNMKFLILVLTLTAILNFAGCGEDGNVIDKNQAGDSVIDNAGDAIEDVGDGIIDGADNMTEGVKDGLKESLDNVTGNDNNNK